MIEQKQFSLLSGESIFGPSLTINLQKEQEAEIFDHYIKSGHNDSYSSILVELQDFSNVMAGFDKPRLKTGNLDGGDIESLPFMIHPNFAPRVTIENIQELGILEDTEYALSARGDVRGNRDIVSTREVIEEFLEFQIQNGADILIPPSFPIRNKHSNLDHEFEYELNQQLEINRKSQAILDGGRLSDELDLMHIYSIEANSMISAEGSIDRKGKILQAISEFDPGAIGLHIQNTNHETYSDDNEEILSLIRELNIIFDIPIFLLNVREFSLVAFLRGASIASTPLARSPYFRPSGNGWSPGNYYHPVYMRGYPPDRLEEMGDSPQLPCYCNACEGKTLERVNDRNERWQRHRRMHFLHVKDSEVKQLVDADFDPEEGLAYKIAGSRKTELLNYLET